ncbi:MAG TPA: hypothetical protein VK013_03385 [Myxococcaceae bacterium]|nr:hypothetical protein [Myxococcaceae bacterium]
MPLLSPRPLLAFLAAMSLLAPGCSPGSMDPIRRDDSNFLLGAKRVDGPEIDRCHRHLDSPRFDACRDALFLAQTWVRGLSIGDSVCMQGGVGEPVGNACMARASVMDARSGALLIEFRETRPDSRYADAVMTQTWYAESALVDLALAEQGW